MDLETLLKRNYNQLIDEECTVAVIDYFSNTNSVEHENIIFIKQLTKVGKHVADTKLNISNSVDFQKKLYQFNIEGLRKIHNNPPNLASSHLLSLESHLNAYAADALKTLFYLSQDLSFAKKAFEHYTTSASISFSFEKEYASFGYFHALSIADTIFNHTSDISWVNPIIDSSIKNNLCDEVKYSFMFNKRQEVVKNTLNNVFYNLKNFEFLENLFEDHMNKGDLIFDSDKDLAFEHYLVASNISEFFFLNNRNNLFWEKNFYDSKKVCADLLLCFNPLESAKLYSSIGDVSFKIYKLNENKHLLMNTYSSFKSAAELYVGLDKHLASENYEKAADIAKKLALSNNSKEWLNTFFENINLSIDTSLGNDSKRAVLYKKLADMNFICYKKSKEKTYALKAVKNYSEAIKRSDYATFSFHHTHLINNRCTSLLNKISSFNN